MRKGSVRQVRNYPDLPIFGEKIINGKSVPELKALENTFTRVVDSDI